jgi:hypothetical protein
VGVLVVHLLVLLELHLGHQPLESFFLPLCLEGHLLMVQVLLEDLLHRV